MALVPLTVKKLVNAGFQVSLEPGAGVAAGFPDDEYVEAGATFSDALRKHPKVFDPLFTNMIAAGEAGGILDTILKRLATYIEKNVKLKSQVKSAMVYPIAVLVIAIFYTSDLSFPALSVAGAIFAVTLVREMFPESRPNKIAVSAIYPEEDVPAEWESFIQKNYELSGL